MAQLGSTNVYGDLSVTGNINGNASSATYATSAGSAPASDVYDWAKAASKPSYTASEVGALKNYSNDASRPNGDTFTLPGGSNAVEMRSGATSGADIGIFYLSDDNAFVCNSSDNGYLFGAFDTDTTTDFSNPDNASFVVLSTNAGTTMKGTCSAASFNATSARDKKENIEKTKVDAVDLLNTVEVVDFNFKDDKEKVPKVGFIADDTDSLLATPNHNQMDVTNCIGILIKSVQEMSAEIKELKEEIKKLKEEK